MTLRIAAGKYSPSDIAKWLKDGKVTEIINIAGTDGVHRVFAEWDDDDAYYLVWPHGGEYNALKKWARTPQRVKVFKDYQKSAAEIIQYVADKAIASI